jgi:predicted MPP superfamily phosphohydrolase
MHRRHFLKAITTVGANLAGLPFLSSSVNDIVISRENLVLSHFKGNLRIVAVSDVHAPGFKLSDGKLVKLINTQLPDIFVLAGDIIDKNGCESLVEFFEAVKAPSAKVATLGNWEYMSGLNLEKLKEHYRRAGINLLINETLHLRRLTIFGFDDWMKGRVDYKALQKNAQRKAPLLIISHCPVVFDHLPENLTIPLVTISGHTHGGQIAPFGKVLITPKGSGPYHRGWYHRNHRSMCVLRGIGTTPWVPLRIGASPEVLVLDLIGQDELKKS